MTAAVSLPPSGPVEEVLPFALRAGTASDVPFVMDAWSMCARDADGHTEGRHFWKFQKLYQRDILARETTRIIVAHPEGEPETIMGYAVLGDCKPPVVYFVYTRFIARRLGVAKLLLAPLLERECIYVCRPGRVFNAAQNTWTPHPVSAKTPKQWRLMPRAAFIEP